MRGRLKKERVASDLVVIGDRVRWSRGLEGTGMIEEVLPRKSVLARTSPAMRPQRGTTRYGEVLQQQVIVANPDQALVVLSLYNPPLNPFMMDRYLVACAAVALPAIIVVNKMDLLEPGGEHDSLALYRRLGYQVHYVSAVSGRGLEQLHDALHHKLSVLAGPSGVGKSSLLNAIWPDLRQQVGEVSQTHDRGKHTTAVARLLQPEPGTYVADTPGMRQFRLWDIDPEQLDAFFPEMLPYLGQCRFAPCTHIHEPGCAVVEAVTREEIAAVRYESYRRIFASDL